VRVIATLDESSYKPLPETYSDAHHAKLLEHAIAWAAGQGETRCRAGKDVAR
jgi:hypothetical protein